MALIDTSGVRPIERRQPTDDVGRVRRREEGTSSAFRPQTNVALKTAIQDLAATLSKISSEEKYGVKKMPDEISEVVKNILRQSFSMDATLGKGIGSTIESQRFSMDQLMLFSRLLSQMGTLAERNYSMKLSDETKLLLTNLKDIVVAESGGEELEPVLMTKSAFELVDAKVAEQLPQALYEMLAQLANMPTATQQQQPPSEGMQFLKQLVKYFIPRPEVDNFAKEQKGTQSEQGQQTRSESSAQKFFSSMFRNFAGRSANQTPQNQPQSQGQPAQFNQPQSQGQPTQFNQPQGQGQPAQFNQSQGQGQPTQFNQPQSQGQPAQFNQPQSQGQPTQFNQPQGQGQPAQFNQSQGQGQPTQFNQPQSQGQPAQFNQPQSQGQPTQFNQSQSQGQPTQFNQSQSQGQPTQFNPSQAQGQPTQFNQPQAQGQATQFNQPQNQGQPTQFNQSQGQGQPTQFNQPQGQGQPTQFNQPQAQGQPAQFNQSQSQGQPAQFNQPQGQGQPAQFNQPQSQGQPAQFNQPQNQGQSTQFNQPQGQGQPTQFNQPQGQGQPTQFNQPQGQGQPTQFNQPQAQGQPAQFNQPQAQGQPTQFNQPQAQGQPTQFNQPQGQGQPTQFNQSQNQGQPTQFNQPQGQGQPTQFNQPQSQGQPTQFNQPQSQGQPTQFNQPQSQGQPTQFNQSQSQGQPTQFNQSQSQGQPAQFNQSQSQGQPAQFNQPQSQGQPTQFNQPQGQGQPAQFNQPQAQGQPTQFNQPQAQGQPTQFNQPQNQGQPTQFNQSQSQGQPAQFNQPQAQGQPTQQAQQPQPEIPLPTFPLNKKFVRRQRDLRRQMDSARNVLTKSTLQNTPQTTHTMKNLAQFLMQNKNLNPRETALLKNFVNNSQQMMSETEARHLQNLLRLCQQNVPFTVRQAAVQQNLPDLPRLWAFMQMCDMANLNSKMTPKALKKAGKDVAAFATSMRGAMSSDNAVIQNQRSFQMMVPLYMGDKELSYPTYFNIYDETERDPDSGETKKETWVRICILTDYVGAVEMVFRIYDENKLDMRFYFSQREVAKEFGEVYVKELKNTMKNLSLKMGEISVGSVGEGIFNYTGA